MIFDSLYNLVWQKPDSVLKEVISWSHGLILVYDVSDRHSFHSIFKLMHVIKLIRSSFCPILLLGNKRDIEVGRRVDCIEGKKLASKFHAHFSEVSFKCNLVLNFSLVFYYFLPFVDEYRMFLWLLILVFVTSLLVLRCSSGIKVIHFLTFFSVSVLAFESCDLIPRTCLSRYTA